MDWNYREPTKQEQETTNFIAITAEGNVHGIWNPATVAWTHVKIPVRAKLEAFAKKHGGSISGGMVHIGDVYFDRHTIDLGDFNTPELEAALIDFIRTRPWEE